MIHRTPLLIEDQYLNQKRKSFKPGVGSKNTAWQPNDSRHSPVTKRVNPVGKQRERAGDPLFDEPHRHRIEPRRRPIGSSIELGRTPLLLDHDHPT